MIQLRFLAAPDSWLGELCSECSAYVKILGIRYAQDKHGMSHFVDITTERDQGDELKRRLSGMKEVVNLDMTELASGHLLGVVTANNCKVCTSIIDVDASCFISSAATEDDCRVGYRLLLSREDVPLVINGLTTSGAEYKIVEISSVFAQYGLTSKQQKILKTASELGFYEFPRRISNEELSEKVGIRPSTLSEILRRAEKKVVARYFEELQ